MPGKPYCVRPRRSMFEQCHDGLERALFVIAGHSMYWLILLG